MEIGFQLRSLTGGDSVASLRDATRMTNTATAPAGTVPHAVHAALLVGAWAALFHFLGNSVFGYVDTPSLFGWLWSNWNGNPDDEIGMFVPVLVGVLVWMKRDEILNCPKKPWPPALALLILGIVLHYVGYAVQQTRLSGYGFVIGLYGVLGSVWGIGLLRTIFFPFVLLFFIVPISSILDSITFPLRMLVTSVSVGFCNGFLDMGVLREGTMIFNATRSYRFDVAAACSGIHSVVAMFLLTVTFGFLNFSQWWRRIVLVAAAIPLAVLGNIVRLITVIVVGDALGQKAGAAIENRFGFVTFLIGLLGMLLMGHLLRENRGPRPVGKPDNNDEEEEEDNAEGDLAKETSRNSRRIA